MVSLRKSESETNAVRTSVDEESTEERKIKHKRVICLSSGDSRYVYYVPTLCDIVWLVRSSNTTPQIPGRRLSREVHAACSEPRCVGSVQTPSTLDLNLIQFHVERGWVGRPEPRDLLARTETEIPRMGPWLPVVTRPV